MKRLSYILGGIAIGALLFVGVSAHAQVTANYWKLSAGTILPNIASWTLTLPYLPSQNCIGTDSNGLLQAGTCGSGGTNYFTNSGINTYLNTGSNLEAPSLSATSTIATSTFSGDVWIGSTGVLPNPDLRIGTSAVPLYGRVLGDVIDAEYDYNGVSSINVANANIGTCAASTYFADGNNPTLGGYYGTFSFLNDGWTNGGGAGCGISASNTDKPEAVVIGSPTGEIDNDIASTSNNGFADFNWNVNNVNKMKLTNGGNLGIGTTSPFATLSVMVGDSYLKQPPSTAFAIGSSSVGTATSTLFNVLSSGNVGIGTTSPYAPLSVMANSNGVSSGITQVVGIGSTSASYATTSLLRLDSNGTLDIGNTAPVTTWSTSGGQLEVSGQTDFLNNTFIPSVNAGIFWTTPGSFSPGFERDSSSNLVYLPPSGATAKQWNTYFGVLGDFSVGSSTFPGKLTVAGDTNDTTIFTTLFAVASSTQNATTTLFDVSNTGNVGISSTSPFSLFSIDVASSSAGTATTNSIGFAMRMLIGGTQYIVQTFDIWGHYITSGPAPTITSCGSTPSGTVSGNDRNGTVTVGGTATGCTLTFAHPYPTAPDCTVTNQGMSVINAMTYTVSASAIVVTQTGLSSDLLNYICQAHQ